MPGIKRTHPGHQPSLRRERTLYPGPISLKSQKSVQVRIIQMSPGNYEIVKDNIMLIKLVSSGEVCCTAVDDLIVLPLHCSDGL
jgi:hypothetical protein